MRYRLFLILLTTALASCSDGVDTCTSSNVKDTVIEIIESNIKKAVWGKELFDQQKVKKLSLSKIKATDFDEQLQRYECEASFNFDFGGNEKTVDVKYVLSYLTEEKETEVAVYGVDEIKSLMMGLAMFGR